MLPNTIQLLDLCPDATGWHDEVLHGLQQPQKQLSPKLFYDEWGSKLFDQITQLPEYYPTETEQAIMDDAIDEMAALFVPNSLLIEHGSGSSQKTRTLLDHLPHLAGYVPIDISRDHLMQTAIALSHVYPDLQILPVCADYETDFELPQPAKPMSRKIAYFPGSTIGNFHPPDAVQFMKRIRRLSGGDGGLLIGVDLKKEAAILNAAYNDNAGITAQFNLNMLTHINQEMGADFDIDTFRHVAFYNEEVGRIEMHLESTCRQLVCVKGNLIPFKAGERIWTESSYKYSLVEFEALANQAGFQLGNVWTDPKQLFSVQYYF